MNVDITRLDIGNREGTVKRFLGGLCKNKILIRLAFAFFEMKTQLFLTLLCFVETRNTIIPILLSSNTFSIVFWFETSIILT